MNLVLHDIGVVRERKPNLTITLGEETARRGTSV